MGKEEPFTVPGNINLPQWKSIQGILKRKKKETQNSVLYNPVIAFLGISLKDSRLKRHRDTCTPVFIVALLTLAGK